MPLLNFQQVRPWAKAIRAALLSGKMPPWQADPQYGKFANDLRLAPGEKETLVAWIDGGAVEGDPADAPKPLAFTEGWQIPKPDVVFEMPRGFRNVPPAAPSTIKYISVRTHFTEDKWVEAAEVRPGNRAAVHHAIVVIDSAQGEQWAGVSGRVCTWNVAADVEAGTGSADQGWGDAGVPDALYGNREAGEGPD